MPAMKKNCVLAPFCDPIDLKKSNFSQITITKPPMLFRRVKMAKKRVSIAFLSSVGPNFEPRNVAFWHFWGLK